LLFYFILFSFYNLFFGGKTLVVKEPNEHPALIFMYKKQYDILHAVVDEITNMVGDKDIGPPPCGYLTLFNVYVALSRGTGRDNIRLLRDFDHSLLQQHPSEFLRLEDDRLLKLNEITKKNWELQRNSIHS
jgi:hypothetical protein